MIFLLCPFVQPPTQKIDQNHGFRIRRALRARRIFPKSVNPSPGRGPPGRGARCARAGWEAAPHRRTSARMLRSAPGRGEAREGNFPRGERPPFFVFPCSTFYTNFFQNKKVEYPSLGFSDTGTGRMKRKRRARDTTPWPRVARHGGPPTAVLVRCRRAV